VADDRLQILTRALMADPGDRGALRAVQAEATRQGSHLGRENLVQAAFDVILRMKVLRGLSLGKSWEITEAKISEGVISGEIFLEPVGMGFPVIQLQVTSFADDSIWAVVVMGLVGGHQRLTIAKIDAWTGIPEVDAIAVEHAIRDALNEFNELKR
jgi:hypothetical protein